MGTRKNSHMLNCTGATELCSLEMERKLTLREDVSLKAHLMMCAGCMNFRKQMEVLHQVMLAYADGRGGSATAPDQSERD